MRNLVVLILMLVPVAAFANGYENYPSPIAWSPDGEWLASVEANDWPYNDGIVSGVLRLYNGDGLPVSELIAGDGIGSPVFNIGNELIAVYGGRIALFPSIGSTAEVKYISASAPVLDCTFEGTYELGRGWDILASVGERFYGANIWRISSDGSQLTQLTFNDSNTSAVQPLSLAFDNFLYLQQPGDSTGAAYERLWSWNKGVKETEAIQYSAPADMLSFPGDYHESNAVVLSSDPLQIVFQRGGWGDWKLIRLGADGVEQVEMEDAEEPSVSGDGRWLAFVRRPAYAKAQAEYDWDVIPQIWLADRECHCLWHVQHSIAGGEFPALSRDGSRLAWIEFNEGRVRTVVRSVEEITATQPSGSY